MTDSLDKDDLDDVKPIEVTIKKEEEKKEVPFEEESLYLTVKEIEEFETGSQD